MRKPCTWCTRATQVTCPECWGTGFTDSPRGISGIKIIPGRAAYVNLPGTPIRGSFVILPSSSDVFKEDGDAIQRNDSN